MLKKLLKAKGLFLLALIIVPFVTIGLYCLSPARVEAMIYGYNHQALNSLRLLLKNEEACHELCFLKRIEERNKLVVNLKNNNTKLLEKMRLILLDSKEDLIFKRELLLVLKQANLKPEYLQDYLNNNKMDLALRGEISLFNDSLDNKKFFSTIAQELSSLKLSEIEQLERLNLLMKSNDDKWFTLYFFLLEQASNLSVKIKALSALSNIINKNLYFTENYQERLILLVDTETTNKYLRKNIIFLLADLIPLNSGKILNYFVNSQNNAKLDVFSRYFITDFLIREYKNNYVFPQISEAEWNEYRVQEGDLKNH
ncbi:MAG: hypothetical protein MUF50_02985 [Planctomycetes bacterium]|nr:hypothetical protein [Planctomycetota bacterium]